jgi:membrane fusion protein (multidrug efflux system)
VFDIADLDPLYADVQVPERQVSRLRPGQVVRVSVDDDEVAPGAGIERIAPSVDPESGTVKVTVAVRPEPGLRPGSFVRIGIVTATHDDALVVSRSALVAEGRRWLVYRLADESGDTVEQIEVERGFEEGNRVEIVRTLGDARPLDTGDRVVVTGASSLSDGATVQVLGDRSGDAEGAGVTT